MNKNKSTRIILVGAVFCAVSCSVLHMKTYTLANGRSRVPADNSVYANKSKFDKSLLDIIDTEAIYEEYDTHYKTLSRLDTNVETATYGCYRFYPDGCLNFFTLNRNEAITALDFDPSYRGYRGVYYLENGKIHCDLFAEINQQQDIGKLTATLEFRGDTLLLQSDKTSTGRNPQVRIYIKRKLPEGYLKFKADW